MNTPYTDVDRLMLDRWAEVSALVDAHDELLRRMSEVVRSVGNRVGTWLEEQGYVWDLVEKEASLCAWKREWEKPRNDSLVLLQFADFAPLGFGEVMEAHPWVWVRIEGLERIKLREADRARFARDLRARLGPAAAKWEHADCEDDSTPLGRYFPEISDQERAAMLAHPARLVEFLEAGFKELFELEPAISETLRKYRQ
ncbi:MAG: hypothetical protein IT177_09920 [Acidobacteria bacterium]|nr:hypothetical protein [Acidobacteriota bacterium]